MDAPDTARFLRKVAFGWPQGQPLPANPLEWAQSQLLTVPPIGILEPDGQLRRDLPSHIRLVQGMEDTMAAYDEINRVEEEMNRLAKTLGPEEYVRRRRDELQIPFTRVEHWKEVQARGTTALYGSAPVFERLWHFWTNHFMVAPGTARNDVLVGPYQRMLREHLTGDFRTLLWNAITHPGMLTYLDNHRNTGPRSKARLQGWTKDTVNENLGRELLELFTLSPAAGYTQKDVEETTLILTGWGIARNGEKRNGYRKPGTFFDFNRHEPGARSVMGQSYDALFRPTAKLEELVTNLARHPATARHLARKLCVCFLQDEPPPESVRAVENAFVSSQGHLPTVHDALLREAWGTMSLTRKFASPETWVLQAHRSLGIDLPRALPLEGQGGLKYFYVLGDLGQALPRCPQPNGWPIRSEEWISKEMLDRRIRYAVLLLKDAPQRFAPEKQEALALGILQPDFLWS